VEGYPPIRAFRNMPRRSFQVGKRTVNRGTTRIRRYVIETPVEREVSLRDQRVSREAQTGYR
jgi:Domain of unknown function (DUF2382)